MAEQTRMTTDDKLSFLARMTGDAFPEELISDYLSLAAEKILAKAYPFDDTVQEVPVKYQQLQLEITLYLLNKRGAEGQTAHSENGINRSYENGDVPDSMLDEITPFCGVVK